jgi:MFS family permease
VPNHLSFCLFDTIGTMNGPPVPPDAAPLPPARPDPACLPYPWLVVAMLWWVSFFNYADRQAIFSVFPLLRDEMHLTKVELGLLGSSFAWVYGLGAPLAGAVVDRVRRKTAILAGLQVWSLICVATALSRRFEHLLVFRAAEGLGETFYYPASTALISDYHGRATRSRALSFHQTSVYVGTIAGGFFAGLIGQHYGWRWSFVVFGGLGMMLGLVLGRFLREPRRGAAERVDDGLNALRPGPRLPLRAVWPLIVKSPTLLLLMLAFLCANFVAMVLLTWMPAYLTEQFGLTLAMAGLTATLFVQVASLVGAPLGGWLADAWRRHTPGGRILVQALGVLGGAPFVFLCGQDFSVAWLIPVLTAWGLCKGCYDANIFAAVFDVVPPEARGTIAGLMNMAGWLGGGAPAPVVVGFIAERYGLGPAIASTALVYVAAGLLLLVAALAFAPRDRPHHSPAPETLKGRSPS